MVINPFQANALVLYTLKTPENLWFSGVLRGYKMGTLATNGLMMEITYGKYGWYVFRLLDAWISRHFFQNATNQEEMMVFK